MLLETKTLEVCNNADSDETALLCSFIIALAFLHQSIIQVVAPLC